MHILRHLQDVSPDPDTIREFLTAITLPGEPFEIRIIGPRPDGPARLRGKTVNGFYDNPEAAVRDIRRFSGVDAAGVYVTINSLDPAVLSWGYNRLGPAKHAAGDAQVTRIRHLFLDFDPKRLPDTNATDEEHEAALQTAREVYQFLRDVLDWPDPVVAGSSGNGALLLFPVDLDPSQKPLVERVVKTIAALFSTDAVDVDVSVANPARIIRVPGTVNAKAETPTAERPWRVADPRILPRAGVVSVEQLEQLVTMLPPSPPPAPGKKPASGDWTISPASYDIPAILDERRIPYTTHDRGYARAYDLKQCLTSSEHAGGAAILQFPNGAVAYRCLHSSCTGKTWQDAKVEFGLPTLSWSANESAVPSKGATILTEPPADDAWPDPIPLDPRHGPAFPIDALPDEIREMVNAVAESTQTPVDMPAIVALGTISAAAGGKYLVQGPGDWEEPVHIQAVVVAEPGSRKSAVFKRMTDPIRDWEQERWPEERVQIAEWESKRKFLERLVNQTERNQ